MGELMGGAGVCNRYCCAWAHKKGVSLKFEKATSKMQAIVRQAISFSSLGAEVIESRTGQKIAEHSKRSNGGEGEGGSRVIVYVFRHAAKDDRPSVTRT